MSRLVGPQEKMPIPAETKHYPWSTLVGLSLIVILGGCLRLFDLGNRSVTHVEMYVPGIRMPAGISVPGERLTLPKVLTGTFSSDTHPPGYYVLMWAWTKCFGTSVWAIRLPSAIFGIGCIPLVFWLGSLTRQRTVGWIAAVLVAVNAHQVFWGQVARMFTLACFLGLLATVLLLLLAKDSHASRSLGFLYVLAILLGLSSHIFFWTLLGTHVLWTFFHAWSQRQPLPGAGRLQILAAILGSPLLAFAAYQNGNDLATLSDNVFVYAREFLQFSFLFPLIGFSSGVYPHESHIFLIDDPHLSVARWLFLLLSLFLLLLGVASIRKSEGRLLADIRGASPRAWVLAAGLGTMAILAFVFMAKAFAKPRPNPTLRTTEVMIVLPFALAGLAIVLQKAWKWLPHWRNSLLGSHLLIGEQALVLALAVIPFAALSAVSLFKGIFNARGLLLLGPYLLLVLAGGIARASRYRLAAVSLFIVLAIAHYAGLRAYHGMAAGRADYKAIATVLAPHLNKADLVFLQPSWYSTPVYYYLNTDWDRFVGRDYQTACHQNPRAQVWVLIFYNYDEDAPKQVRDALWNYQVVQTIEAPGARAILYSPRNF
jgi:hypothetical protein